MCAIPRLIMRNDILRGGKYKGMKLAYVIDNHPSYIRWAMRENIFRITDRAESLLQKAERSGKGKKYR